MYANTRLILVLAFICLLTAPKVSNAFENIKLFARPAIGVSWFKLKAMEIDARFVCGNNTCNPAHENYDPPPSTVEELSELEQSVGAKAFYTGSGLNVGISAGIQIKSLGLGIHYAWASIDTNDGEGLSIQERKKVGGYYKEYTFTVTDQNQFKALGISEFETGTIKYSRILFELSYGIPFWRFEFAFTTRMGAIKLDEGKLQVGTALAEKDKGLTGDIGGTLTAFPVDFLGLGIGGYGGFYTFNGKYEGAYGIVIGFLGSITLQL